MVVKESPDVDINCRMSHWRPTPSWSTNPQSPARKEAFRVESLAKQDNTYCKSTGRLAAYLPRSQSLSRSRPLDHTRWLKDSAPLDWMHQPGVRPSLPTNVPESTTTVNVNIIRYKREQVYNSATHLDGGPAYQANVCVGNWVEERLDPGFRSGTHPKELKLDRRYDSEYTHRYRPHDPDYAARIKSLYGTAQLPQPPKIKTGNDADGSYVYYSNQGFGEMPRQDHTVDSKRGANWVGTAPVGEHETIYHTVTKPQRLEFQNRNPAADAKQKILLGLERKPIWGRDESVEKTTAQLREGERYVNKYWTTNYKTDYCERAFPHNSYKPNGFGNHASQHGLMTTYTHSYVDHRHNLHNWPKGKGAESLAGRPNTSVGFADSVAAPAAQEARPKTSAV